MEWHHFCCHGDSFAQVKVYEAQKECEKNFHQDAIKQNVKPKFPQQTTVKEEIFVGENFVLILRKPFVRNLIS